MRRRRILVVDDEAGIREGLRAFLEREGYAVQTAGDASGAVRWIKRMPIDCLLIDLNLSPDYDPTFDGLDVIALLRVHQPEAKAVLISASQDPSLTGVAAAWGAVARMEKPLDLASLRHLLRSLLQGNGEASAIPSVHHYPSS